MATVTVWAGLVVFTNCRPKLRALGISATGDTPVPVNWAVWGLLEALSLTVRVPVRVPKPLGINVTEIVQPDLAASVLGKIGQFELCAKSPEVVMLVMVSGAV